MPHPYEILQQIIFLVSLFFFADFSYFIVRPRFCNASKKSKKESISYSPMKMHGLPIQIRNPIGVDTLSRYFLDTPIVYFSSNICSSLLIMHNDIFFSFL